MSPRQKMLWFGPVTRHNSLRMTIIRGTVESGRKRGRYAKEWIDMILFGLRIPLVVI